MRSVTPMPAPAMNRLLTTTGVLELFTGVALVAMPSEVATILLGGPLEDGVARTVARVAGGALMSIGMGCVMAARIPDPRLARTTTIALLFYNCFVVIILVEAFGVDHVRGIGLWPAAILHTALAAWCIACLRPRGLGHAHPARPTE